MTTGSIFISHAPPESLCFDFDALIGGWNNMRMGAGGVEDINEELGKTLYAHMRPMPSYFTCSHPPVRERVHTI